MKPTISKDTMRDVRIVRWRGGQHPTQQTISGQMEREGLRPYACAHGPNARLPIRSHGFHKVLYCVEGALEIVFPDMEQRLIMRPGDRLEIPRGTRYAGIISIHGARLLESVAVTSLLS